VRRADAPPPGWYPDPTGGQRLWWWDGMDWTDHQRVAPRAGRVAMEDELAAAGHGVAPRIRSGGPARSTAGVARDDVSAIVDEVRKVTRQEIDRATRGLADGATSARQQLEPLISEYGTKLVGWAKRLVVIAVVLYVLYLAVTGAVQTGLMGWLGDRVDNAVNGAGVHLVVDEPPRRAMAGA
jgi:hypothetical protein